MIQRNFSNKTRDKKSVHLKPKRDFQAWLKFVVIAALLMLILDFGIWGDGRPYVENMKKQYYAEQAAKEKVAKEKQKRLDQAIEDLLPETIEFEEPKSLQTVYPDNGAFYFESPEDKVVREWQEGEPKEEVSDAPVSEDKKSVQATNKDKKLVPLSNPKVVIVIDDVGMNLKYSRQAIDLPAGVTLAFLPYAEKIQQLTKDAKDKGHELIIHTPMEAVSKKVTLGSMALRDGMSESVFQLEFERILKSFEGYVGVNNHMGSLLTQDKDRMKHLMKILKKRDLFFLDSKTIHTSVAAKTAKEVGVSYAVRDVFLDHEETKEFLENAFENVERIARRYGHAIAIGHPKAVTIEGLRKWLPPLKEKGFDLVPLSAVLIHPNDEEETQVSNGSDDLSQAK